MNRQNLSLHVKVFKQKKNLTFKKANNSKVFETKIANTSHLLSL